MKQSAIITAVRQEFGNTDSATTWPDTTLREYILDGVQQLHSDCPENRLIGKIKAEIYGDDEMLPLSELFRNALVQYVLHRCYMRDSEDARDLDRAKAHFANYQALLGLT